MKRALGLFFLVAIAASCGTARHEQREHSSAEAQLSVLRARFPGVLDRKPVDASPPKLHVEIGAEIVVTDPKSGIGARVRPERALGAREDVDGLAVFAQSEVVVRTSRDRVEDFVSFDRAPAREEAVYRIALIGGAALRLVGRNASLELLDPGGAPRVRMNAPWILGANGEKRDASVAVEGCAYDASPAAPWDRPTTPPGAGDCTVRIAWRDVGYPALLDPSWSVTDSMGNERDEHMAVKLANGKVIITYGNRCDNGCGGVANANGDLYDPTTKTFAASGMADDRTSSAPAVLLPNGKALFMGPAPQGAWLYEPVPGQFVDGGASTIQRSKGSTATLLGNGKVLAAGGEGAATSSELYDPTNNTWSLGPTLKTARSRHTATLLANGKVLLAGGGTDTAELYDPVANDFTLTGSMSVARAGHDAARVASGKVLIAGGDTKDLEVYDPAAGTFSKAPMPLTEARTALALVTMRSGNVYVTGGCAEGLATPIVERWNPNTGELTAAPFFAVPRCHHRVTPLDSGIILVTGGRNADDVTGESSYSSAEELSVTAAGAACAIGDDCASGICDQGVCCIAACTDTCKSCVGGTGQCLPVTSADDPSSCTGASTCDATGACKKKKGQACAANTDCASGSCADGVCCDRACTGACEACDGPNKGVCETIAGPPHGARSCKTDGTACGGACDGTKIECSFPNTSTGCGTSCAEGARIARACSGDGACIAQQPRPCPGNFACADEKSCRTTCATNAECARAYACETGKCVPTATCDGDHTIVGADGKSKTDCTPFRCDVETNRCRTSCEDVEQCAEPFFCESSGQCIAPPKAPSGCDVVRHSPSNERASILGLVALALVGTMRRKRCR